MYHRSDEISAVVFDPGTQSLKCGFAGSELPWGLIPWNLGMFGASSGRRNISGTGGLSVSHPGMEVVSPMAGGLISDWDMACELFSHAYREVLQVEPHEHPLLFCEPAFNTTPLREAATEMFFEKYNVPAFFLAKTPVLVSFAFGRASAVVVESGYEYSVVTPVHNGYALTKAMQRSPVAGKVLSEALGHIIEHDQGIEIMPTYQCRRRVNEEGVCRYEGPRESLDVTKSFHRYQVELLLDSIKEGCCAIADAAAYVGSDISNASTHAPVLEGNSYVLPNDQVVNTTRLKHMIPEILLNPKAFIPPTMPNAATLASFPGISQLISNAVAACDADVRKDFYQNIVCTGGSTLFPGFLERILSDFAVGSQPQPSRGKNATSTNEERRFAAFIGGSILGCLGTFHVMWISRQEYEEHGRSIIGKKCP